MTSQSLMSLTKPLPWIHPLELAASIEADSLVLLYSGVQESYSGRYSLLACNLEEHVEAADFSVFEKKLTSDKATLENAWFGYFGYGLKDSLETLYRETPNWVSPAPLCMMRFSTICVFDHLEQKLGYWGQPPLIPDMVPTAASLPTVLSIHSNMTGEHYLSYVAQIISDINAGKIYQANLTRKFIGEFEDTPHAFSLFRKLCEVSPAPYSAFLKLGKTYVLSSSPERFLSIDSERYITTRPIKGTAPRSSITSEDNKFRDDLAASSKDKAENLMIVDLMRNDLSRACKAGSVKVENLFSITSHSNVHHLSSTISGNLRPDCGTLKAIAHCFPPGSMTGAPKIAAMNLCAQLEHAERGIYSGAIGWLGGDGSADLSVVIRTLILKGNRFEFQVGGGIVADSIPEKELQETFHKARGILKAIGLEENAISSI